MSLQCSGVAEIETASESDKLMANKFHINFTKNTQMSEMSSVLFGVVVVRRKLKPSIDFVVNGKGNEPTARCSLKINWIKSTLGLSILLENSPGEWAFKFYFSPFPKGASTHGRKLFMDVSEWKHNSRDIASTSSNLSNLY
jgi:hypothetical protein